ncbi:MAG: DUF2071 domain-containing protein [Bacteroidota bacterium]
MKISTIAGWLTWRIAVNYRVAPHVMREWIPAPFRPKLIEGHALAGLDLIHQKNQRIAGLPKRMGITSYLAVHRVLVEWEEMGMRKTGMFILRRDSSLGVHAWAGGRMYPGLFHRARFKATHEEDAFSLRMRSRDHQTIAFEAQTTNRFPHYASFGQVNRVASAIRAASSAYQARPDHHDIYEGVEWNINSWHPQPLRVTHLHASLFADMPKGSIFFDHAFLVADSPHQWIRLPEMIQSRPVDIPFGERFWV